MKVQDSLTLLNVASLLHYPDETMEATLAGVEQELLFLSNENAAALSTFLCSARQRSLEALQEEYVRTFDMNAPCSLYLAWHKYGDDPKLGRALASINELYRDAGFEPLQGVMPDYAPRVFEFMAHAPDWAVQVFLDGFGKEMAMLDENVRATDSLYAPIVHTGMRILLPAPSEPHESHIPGRHSSAEQLCKKGCSHPVTSTCKGTLEDI